MVGLLSNPSTFLNSGSLDFNPLVYFRVSSKCVGRRILQMNEVRAELLFALSIFVVFLSSSSRSMDEILIFPPEIAITEVVLLLFMSH
jgi:hypothetical protein